MEIIQFFLLVIFVEAVTEILVDAKITEDLRLFLFNLAHPSASQMISPQPGPFCWRFLNDLLSCGYCTSVWVSMFAALFAPWWICVDFQIGRLINWLVMVFVLHRISNFFHIIFSIIKKGRVKTYDIEIAHKHQVDNHGSDGQVGS